jgi:hypothetical protein
MVGMGMGIGIEAAAVAVASGKRGIADDVSALSIIEANQGSPVPVAMHRAGDWCSVFFITKQIDGQWRTDIVPVHNGDVGSYGGGIGGIVRRSELEQGKPFVEGMGQHFLDDETALHQVDGISADEAVRMRWRDEVVAEATVAAHGYFVLTAILPADAEVTVEAA